MDNELSVGLYQTLLESVKAIPWKMDWQSQEFVYIGPQIEDLLGWSPESWRSSADWAERMHPDDREKTVSYCVGLSEKGVDHEADYRALKKDGSFSWIRDVVHVIRENNQTIAIVGFMFDISERKRMEEQQNELNQKLELLSLQDGHTGICNRRAFDNALQTEYERARRYKRPLSVIFIDIDYFKNYNDYYGHLQGDDCLKRVTNALKSVVTRATDYLARYGGEEFIILLPETDNQSAVQIAEKCRAAIFEKQIVHVQSEEYQVITISAGVNTVIPDGKSNSANFIRDADQFLYQAKHNGRNRVEHKS